MSRKTVRLVLILLVLIVSAYYLLPMFVSDSLPNFWTKKRIKLGLDLRGGMQILLEVDTSKLPTDERENAVKSALEIIRNRIDQFGVAEPSIQRVGENRIIVQLPGLKEFSRAKNLIGKTALLEFKLVASPEEQKSAIERLDSFLKDYNAMYPALQKLAAANKIEEKEQTSDVLNDIKKDDTPADSSKAGIYDDLFSQLISSSGYEMTIASENVELFNNLLKDESIKRVIPAGIQIALGSEEKDNPNAPRPIYFLIDRAELTGKYLESAKTQIGSGYDPKTANKPYVSLKFNKQGARIFEQVTGKNIHKQLAIVLDGVVYKAPTIQDKIRGGEAQVTGSFSMQECQDLVIVLKAGNLPAPVSVLEERTVGPTLGADSIKAGVTSALIGLILVVLFMIVYYGLSGILADIALMVNMMIILSAMTILGGTLTMPGIGGIILTIGMAVDANVLIFERIREELANGKSPRTAVEAGFSRAIVTILDANITTLITAVVLYQFGTGPIRGFAVTLSIGIISSMFTAIVLVKAIYDGLITKNNPSKLSI